LTAILSWDTGAGWSNRAGKAAYESRRDYIIAVKGKIRLRVTLSTQSESAAFRSSGDLWCGVVHDGVIRRCSAILSELQFTIVTVKYLKSRTEGVVAGPQRSICKTASGY